MGTTFSRANLIRNVYTAQASRSFLHVALSESLFGAAMYMERRRAERSGGVLLVASIRLVDRQGRDDGAILTSIAQTLISTVRETDVVGWLETGSVIGVLFTESCNSTGAGCCAVLEGRIKGAIVKKCGVGIAGRVEISLSQLGENEPNPAYAGPDPYPCRRGVTVTVERSAKRLLDMVLSVAVLFVCSPVLLLIVLGIKLTSEGPVVYKQTRVGQHGRTFTLLKFRSMFQDADNTLHQEFVTRFIENSDNDEQCHGSGPVYKIVDDPRITPLGRFLRRSSLDELPQLINVLRGEMSLVGPRPPLPYEVDRYKPWHRRRVLESTPGITGLWQIKGRSRLSFDDAVRLDLEYIRNWSLWLDLVILLKTPAVVLSGQGAY